MSKLDELKSLVSKMFDEAENKADIERYAQVKQKMDEVYEEQTAHQDEYKQLLDDYKDAVKHQNFKSENKHADATPEPKFDADKAFYDFFLAPKENK